ncbi:MAG TPA: glycogen synthase GlgA [Verrucomicrobiae bacterium]
MNVLLASSECFPFSKTGGLADMVAALGKALAVDGHRVRIVTPLYRGIREKYSAIQRTDRTITVQLDGRIVSGTIWTVEVAPRCEVLFLENPEFYDRASLYGEGGRDYADNAARFIFLSKAVTYLARALEDPPEVVHVHDWQVGIVPILIQHEALVTGWKNAPATVLTIHNLAYQGVFPPLDYQLTNLPQEYFTPDGIEFYNQMSCLKAGIVYADIITTVSPRYAREITTEQYGCGLDGVLRSRHDHLIGILNGVDYGEWKTEGNKFLKFAYSSENFKGKADQKAALQAEMGLPVIADVPLFGTVSRLAEQKGVDILISALEEMLSSNMQFVLLGSGDPAYERGFRTLADRHPEKVAIKIGYDHGLAHRIEAGCDFFLMPSRFEPCGLNQMYSLRYGTIPIVRVTGGLDDSVTDVSEDPEIADGIKFTEYSSRALVKAIRKALVLYGNKELLRHFRQNGMSVDFSWEHCTHEYEAAFERAIELRRARSLP